MNSSSGAVHEEDRASGRFPGPAAAGGVLSPYVLKLPQIDITLILLGGLALAAFDYFTPGPSDPRVGARYGLSPPDAACPAAGAACRAALTAAGRLRTVAPSCPAIPT
jgi:hypothetical protein